MTDEKFESEESAVPEGLTLEHVLRRHAEQHFGAASKAGLGPYYLELRKFTTDQYRDEKRIRRNIDDFLVDRYIFWSRHLELDKTDSQQLAYRDAFEYMVFLHNGYSLRYAPMREDWRD